MAIPFILSHNLSVGMAGTIPKPAGFAIASIASFAYSDSNVVLLHVCLISMSGCISLVGGRGPWCSLEFNTGAAVRSTRLLRLRLIVILLSSRCEYQ